MSKRKMFKRKEKYSQEIPVKNQALNQMSVQKNIKMQSKNLHRKGRTRH